MIGFVSLFGCHFKADGCVMILRLETTKLHNEKFRVKICPKFMFKLFHDNFVLIQNTRVCVEILTGDMNIYMILYNINNGWKSIVEKNSDVRWYLY